MLNYGYAYRSATNIKTHLVLRDKDDFGTVPEAELRVFGRPEFVKLLHLDRGRPITMSESDLSQLENKGYIFIGSLSVRWEESSTS